MKHKQLQAYLALVHAMILVLLILTPFTTTPSISLFFAFRATQARLMLLAVIPGITPNSKLKAILEGCARLHHLWGSDLSSHLLVMQEVSQPNSVSIRFAHIVNLQPKFYIGSTCNGVLDREHTRVRKFLQLRQDRLVQAELSIRF